MPDKEGKARLTKPAILKEFKSHEYTLNDF